jgi:1,4-alpha-glucan branching enzyme
MTANRNFPAVSKLALVEKDPYLEPFTDILRRRMGKVEKTAVRLAGGTGSLKVFACGHEYFGLHFSKDGWVFREWAPNASAVYLTGEMTGWLEDPAFALKRIGRRGVWELHMPPDVFKHKDHYRLRIHWPGGSGDRIPAWTRRVVQDPETQIFNAQVWSPPSSYVWQSGDFKRSSTPPLIYEAHVGMAQEAEKIGSYREFADQVIPRIAAAGYNTLQLMAVPEHPYYGSFGYHVSSFFALSSRFGTPEAFKQLVDTAHVAGLAVVIDLVHSHSVSNEVEGLGCFDGSAYQYFHDGHRGRHEAWGSRCFDYGKDAVIHFLLSNCRFWLDEYRVDGFRFDGVTSMLYHHHGLGKAFTCYDDYFDDTVDEEALVYLGLANRLIHDLRPDAVTLAEDVSGMPGLAAPLEEGGVGFDYRFAMGVPDHWIRLTKDTPDESWPMEPLWHELTNRRKEEKTVSYTESHDQALVGDQTLAFRMMGPAMYNHMRIEDENITVTRGMALHKMIRLITLATAGNGYLNFMGNEFGHPEWIDFPREGNDWSLKHARRQWSLVDAPELKYRLLAAFDREMMVLARVFGFLEIPEITLLHEHTDDKVLAFQRASLVFAFNFHPSRSHADYRIAAPPGAYRMILNSDAPAYGGHGRLATEHEHFTLVEKENGGDKHFLSLYLPNRTAVVLKGVPG